MATASSSHRSTKKRATRKLAARKPAARKPAARRAPAKKGSPRRWSQKVTETSDAMTLEPHLFQQKDAAGIARSVLRSAQRSQRRKSTPFRSAMSMLTFYENRAGKNLGAAARAKLERAKKALRAMHGKEKG